MSDHIADPVHAPAHYAIYPVQPIEIARFLGFCLGNAVKYILRAPWKGGVEDCDKAMRYLRWEEESPQEQMSRMQLAMVNEACNRLAEYMRLTPGDGLWCDISEVQGRAIEHLQNYIFFLCHPAKGLRYMVDMQVEVRGLRNILVMRDTPGQIYEGQTGLPDQEGARP